MSKPEPVRYVRKRHAIYMADGKSLWQSFPSISAAKKESLRLQRSGCVVTVDHSVDPKPMPAYKAALKKHPLTREQEMRRKRLDAPENSIRDRVRQQLGVKA